MVADLSADGEPTSRNLTYLEPVKDVHLKAAHLSVAITGAKGDYKIRVSSPVLARSVYLAFGNLDIQVSDDYFDVLPGETVEITAKGAAPLAALQEQLKAISLTDAFAGDMQAAAAKVSQ